MQFLSVELLICALGGGLDEERERNIWPIRKNPPFTVKKLLSEIINFIFVISVPPHPTGAVSCKIGQVVWLHLVSWPALQTAGGGAGGQGPAPAGKQSLKVVEVEAVGFTEGVW